MVLNMPLSHKLSICCYNTDENRDPSKNREKRDDKEHHEKASFFSSS